MKNSRVSNRFVLLFDFVSVSKKHNSLLFCFVSFTNSCTISTNAICSDLPVFLHPTMGVENNLGCVIVPMRTHGCISIVLKSSELQI